MAKSKISKINGNISKSVKKVYNLTRDVTVGGYKRIENAVVKDYRKIEDSFVNRYLTHDGETVEAAKARIKKETNKI